MNSKRHFRVGKLPYSPEIWMKLTAGTIYIYQTSHLFSEFMGEPRGQLKSREKSLMFDNGPSTRNWAGECTPVVILIFIDSGRYTEHQVCAAEIQNSCSGEYSRPGSDGSAPLSSTHFL